MGESRTILVCLGGKYTEKDWKRAVGFWTGKECSSVRGFTGRNPCGWNSDPQYFYHGVKSRQDLTGCAGVKDFSTQVKSVNRRFVVHIPDVDKVSWDDVFQGLVNTLPHYRMYDFGPYMYYDVDITDDPCKSSKDGTGKSKINKEKRVAEFRKKRFDNLSRNVKETIKIEAERHIQLVKNCLDLVCDASDVSELMGAKRALLVAMLDNLPNGCNQCIFCAYIGREHMEPTRENCQDCPYQKKHGNCFNDNSDYRQMTNAFALARTAIKKYFIEGEVSDYGEWEAAIEKSQGINPLED